MLGLGSNLSKVGLSTPGIVTDNLVLKHNYNAGAVVPVSDGAAYFTGTGNRIVLSSDIVHALSGGTTTYCFWANRASVNSWDIALGYNGQSSYRFIVFDDDADRLQVESDTDGSAAYGTISPAMSANEWHHFAVTMNSGTVAMYMDGVSLTMADATIGSDDTTINCIGGGANSSNNCFHGYMCNVGIWNSILTQAQIKSIMWKNYAGLSDSEKTNLVSWWNLDKTIGQTIDSSINTNNSNNPTASYNYSDKLVFDNNGSFNTTVLEETLSADVESDGGGTSGGWSLGVNIRAVGDVTTVTKNGRRAIKIQNGSEDDSESQNSMYKTVACTVGKVYKFSCYMMTDTPMTTPTKSLRMGAYDSGEDPDGQYSAYTNATDWEYASVYMRADTTSINFYLRSANDTGTGISNVTYFSGMKVEESSGNDGELI